MTYTTLDKLETRYLFQRLGSRPAWKHHLLFVDVTMLNCNDIIIIIIIIVIIIIITTLEEHYRMFSRALK